MKQEIEVVPVIHIVTGEAEWALSSGLAGVVDLNLQAVVVEKIVVIEEARLKSEHVLVEIGVLNGYFSLEIVKT